MPKGMGSHQSSRAGTTTWLTPRFITDALGEFDLDPCSAPDPSAWPTARRHYTWPMQDGMALPWEGRVWLNPPYGDEADAWMRKMAGHGRGTALIFARTETEMFFRHVWERADALLFLRGRLHFHHADGRRSKANSGAPSVLIAYGRHDAEALLDSGLDGSPVALKVPVMVHLSLAEAEAPGTWREIVSDALASLGGRSTLEQVYQALEGHPKVASNGHWRAKVRQTMARSRRIDRVGSGEYRLAA